MLIIKIFLLALVWAASSYGCGGGKSKPNDAHKAVQIVEADSETPRSDNSEKPEERDAFVNPYGAHPPENIIDFFLVYAAWRQENPVNDHYNTDVLLRSAFAAVRDDMYGEDDKIIKIADSQHGYIEYDYYFIAHEGAFRLEAKCLPTSDHQKVIFAANYVTNDAKPFTCRIDFAVFERATGEMKPVAPWDIVQPLGVDSWFKHYATNNARAVLFRFQHFSDFILLETDDENDNNHDTIVTALILEGDKLENVPYGTALRMQSFIDNSTREELRKQVIEYLDDAESNGQSVGSPVYYLLEALNDPKLNERAEKINQKAQ